MQGAINPHGNNGPPNPQDMLSGGRRNQTTLHFVQLVAKECNIMNNFSSSCYSVLFLHPIFLASLYLNVIIDLPKEVG